MCTGYTFEIKGFFSLFIFLHTKIKSEEISYHALCTFCLIFFSNFDLITYISKWFGYISQKFKITFSFLIQRQEQLNIWFQNRQLTSPPQKKTNRKKTWCNYHHCDSFWSLSYKSLYWCCITYKHARISYYLTISCAFWFCFFQKVWTIMNITMHSSISIKKSIYVAEIHLQYFVF